MLCKQKIISILGPTAIGKTHIGIRLAERLNREIISIDSRQIYRYMNIGTAKPNDAELQRVQHHFIDVVDPDQQYSAGQFGREARQLIEKKNKAILIFIPNNQ